MADRRNAFFRFTTYERYLLMAIIFNFCVDIGTVFEVVVEVVADLLTLDNNTSWWEYIGMVVSRVPNPLDAYGHRCRSCGVSTISSQGASNEQGTKSPAVRCGRNFRY